MNRIHLATLLVSCTLAAQTFEVATIRSVPAITPLGFNLQGGPGTASPGRIDYLNAPLKLLLQRAYNFKPSQISGPGWMDNERYNVVATLPPGATKEDLQTMLRKLLVERFQIQSHFEPRTLPVFRMTVSPGGHKLKAPESPIAYANDAEALAALRARVEANTPKDGTPRATYSVPTGSVDAIVQALEGLVDRPITDATELNGTYSFRLSWIPEGAKMPDGTIPFGPSLQQAIEQQLGLRLEPRDEPMEILVIDRISRTPTEN